MGDHQLQHKDLEKKTSKHKMCFSAEMITGSLWDARVSTVLLSDKETVFTHGLQMEVDEI